jgi:hypothetical protein
MPYFPPCIGETEAEDSDEDMESEVGSAGSAKKTTDQEPAQKQKDSCRLDDNDIEVLREKFPFLKQLSTNYIKGLTPRELLNMEKASIKRGEHERFKDAEDRLTSNWIDLGITTAKVMAGLDDRWAKLRNGQFLAGAGCSASKLWLTARIQPSTPTTWHQWDWQATSHRGAGWRPTTPHHQK